MSSNSLFGRVSHLESDEPLWVWFSGLEISRFWGTKSADKGKILQNECNATLAQSNDTQGGGILYCKNSGKLCKECECGKQVNGALFTRADKQ